LEKKVWNFFLERRCQALGIWVAILKQPDALPGRAPKKMKYIYIYLLLNHFCFFINNFYFLEFF
jgi:hypothetical protein